MRLSSRWSAIALPALLAAACRRTPPEGSGNAELAPLGSASENARPTHVIASFPGGAVLVGDVGNCNMSRIDRELGVRWQRALPVCGGRLAIAVAPDSTAFARTGSGLVAIGSDGNEKWRLAVGNDPIPDALFPPAVTLDSLVVVSRSRNAVVAFKGDGSEAWRFQLPDDEPLVTAPLGGAGEGTFVTTSMAIYLVGSDGATRFRRALPTPRP